MREDNVAIRLKGYIDSTGLTSSQFADQCGIPRPTLSQLLSGRNKKISDVLVGQIHSAFPDLSILWLLFGEGEMLVSNKDNEESQDSDEVPELYEAEGRRMESGSLIANNAGGERRVQPSPAEIYSDDLNLLLIEKDRKLEELSKELELLKKNPRRVAQITVYYDDSTFETFVPGGSNYKGR